MQPIQLPKKPLKTPLSRVLSLIALALCALSSLGTTCENQDFSDLEILTFSAPKDGTIFKQSVFQSYEARSVLDFRVKNGSDNPLSVIVRARPIRAGRTADNDDVGDTSEDTLQDADAAACFEDDPAACPDVGNTDAGGSTDASSDTQSADADVVDLTDTDPSDAEDICIPLNQVEDERSVQGERRINLQGFGQWRAGRFGEDELQTGIGVEIELEVVCTESEGPDCSPSGLGEVEYTLLGKQYECQASTDCSSDQTCDESLGLCVGRACGPNSPCPQDQECNDLCRCVETGCFCATPASAPRGFPWGLCIVSFFALCVLWTRRVRRSPRRRSRAGRNALLGSVMLVALTTITLIQTPEASAQRMTFERPSAAAFAGIGTRNLTGKIGELTSTGVELYYGQSIQYRYFGFRASVGTSYFLTKQIPPPITRGVQFYSLRFSPMLIFPIYMFQLQIDPIEYERVGMISNTLVRTTGNDQSFNAFGGGATLLWEPSPFIMLGVRSSYNQFTDVSKAVQFEASAFDLGGIFSLTFQIAVLGNI